MIVCWAEIPFPCAKTDLLARRVLKWHWGVFSLCGCIVSGAEVAIVSLLKSHFWYKEVVFCLACCTVCNNLTLFSLLSFTICLAPFSHLSPSTVTFVFCNAHMVAHHTIYFVLDIPPPLLCVLSSPFLSLLSLLSLSVMAYQDGFYSAADLYVSIPPLSSTFSLLPTFLLCLSAFKCDTAWNKPIELCTYGCLYSSQLSTYCSSDWIWNGQIFINYDNFLLNYFCKCT